MKRVYLPWAPTFEGGKCVSSAHLLGVSSGKNRPSGEVGELYANEETGMLEIYIGNEWLILGKIDEWCVRREI